MFFLKRRATRQAIEILSYPSITFSAIRCLKNSLIAGHIDGNWPEDCFFGRLAAGMGITCEQLIEKNFGHVHKDDEKYIAIIAYTMGIRLGTKPHRNARAQHLLELCNAELARRRSICKREKAEAVEQLLQEVMAVNAPNGERELVNA